MRVMRPYEDQVVFKRSGMHAVEDYIMSRYQMYWQVYFHPVTRSAEVILNAILARARTLYKQGYAFKHQPAHFYSFFTGKPSLDDYLRLDESVVLYYFHVWQEENDPILQDLCSRFLNRRLFKYVEFDPSREYMKFRELEDLFYKIDIDPKYYLVVDSSSDLPYDFYRPGEEGERLPILLLMPDGELRELSRESDIVEAISGKRRTDHKLYYPQDLLECHPDQQTVRQIKELLYSY